MHPVPLLLIALLTVAARCAEAQVFYTVTAPDGQPNWLLGTLHSDDPRLLAFPPVLEQALREARTVALELAPGPEALAVLERRMLLPEGESLAGRIDADLYRRVVEVLDERGVPETRAQRLRPWAAAMTLAQPPFSGGQFMDLVIARRAAAAGAEVVGLETPDEQIGFFSGLGRPAQQRVLERAVEAAECPGDAFEVLIGAYLDGDLGRLMALTQEQLAPLGPELAERFITEGIERRNRRIAERAGPRLERGRLLIAVGALHLPGKAGLVALLEAQGYRVVPVY